MMPIQQTVYYAGGERVKHWYSRRVGDGHDSLRTMLSRLEQPNVLLLRLPRCLIVRHSFSQS